jgi:hypothetical protein
MHAILVLGVRVERIAELMHEEEKRAGCRAFSGVLTNCLVLGLGTYVSTSHERSIRSDSNSPWGENLSTAPRCGARQQQPGLLQWWPPYMSTSRRPYMSTSAKTPKKVDI